MLLLCKIVISVIKLVLLLGLLTITEDVLESPCILSNCQIIKLLHFFFYLRHSTEKHKIITWQTVNFYKQTLFSKLGYLTTKTNSDGNRAQCDAEQRDSFLFAAPMVSAPVLNVGTVQCDWLFSWQRCQQPGSKDALWLHLDFYDWTMTRTHTFFNFSDCEEIWCFHTWWTWGIIATSKNLSAKHETFLAKFDWTSFPTWPLCKQQQLPSTCPEAQQRYEIALWIHLQGWIKH